MNKVYRFDQLPPSRLKEICSKGGKRAHELRKAHRFTPEEARAAGKKGHEARRTKKQARLVAAQNLGEIKA